ncbi:hypothetical protein G3I17_06260 [Streptomyces sp. SID13031]|nr:hypothetical protein [Streptomyces sp. SID13031]
MVIAATVRRRLVLITVQGGSMLPTFSSGDRVLVDQIGARRLRTGQIVVLQGPHPDHRDGWGWSTDPIPRTGLASHDWLIKRVIAVPSDPVPEEVQGVLGTGAESRVPVGRLVVRGDAPHSADSRQWGLVPVDRVLGVVVRRVRPATAPA